MDSLYIYQQLILLWDQHGHPWDRKNQSFHYLQAQVSIPEGVPTAPGNINMRNRRRQRGLCKRVIIEFPKFQRGQRSIIAEPSSNKGPSRVTTLMGLLQALKMGTPKGILLPYLNSLGSAPSTPASHYFIPQSTNQALDEKNRDKDDCIEVTLLEKIQLTHDTIKFVFKLPLADQVIGLPVGGHVFFHFTDPATGELVSRKYTPVSTVNEKGKVAFVIKVYHPNTEFPQGGAMSVYLSKMNVGDKIKLEGPKGLLFYEGSGNFKLKTKPINKTKIGLIAGGTGITPCYQIIQAASLAKESTPITLIYSNKTKDDILLQTELDGFSKTNSNFKLVHTLTRHDESKHGQWVHFKGRVNEEMVKSHLPPPGKDTLIGYCGPAEFNKAVEATLKKMGYEADMMHKF